MIPGETVTDGAPLASPAHDGDPIAFFQDNQAGGPGGTAACANDQFNVNGAFRVRETGSSAPSRSTTPARTALDLTSAYRVVVTVAADGAYTVTVTPLDVDGNVVAAFQTGTAPFTFAGTVPGDELTQFVPFVRVRPGIDTGNGLEPPDTPWEYTISATDLVAPQADPAATVSEIECAEDGSGTVVLTTSNPGTAGALLTVTADETIRLPVLLAGGGEATESFTVPAGGSIALDVSWVGGSLLEEIVTSEACVVQTTTTTTTTTHDDHHNSDDHHHDADVDHTTSTPAATSTTADPGDGALAETGSSSSAPLATAGVICLVAGAAALALVRLTSARRRRAQ